MLPLGFLDAPCEDCFLSDGSSTIQYNSVYNNVYVQQIETRQQLACKEKQHQYNN